MITLFNILRWILIILIGIAAIPLYLFFGFGSLFAFDAPGSLTIFNLFKLLIMDGTVFITPVAMIAGLICGNKINPKYYILTIIFPILLFCAMKWFFIDM